MSRSESVTYVIPTYNGATTLRETIDAALAQTWPNVDVLVLDDGSKDDTVAVARGYGGRVRVEARKNRGVCGARNQGLALATGEFVCLLDQDDLIAPTHAEEMTRPMREDPAIDAVFCDVRIFEGDPNAPSDERIDDYSAYAADPNAFFKVRMTWSMGAIMMRREALQWLGGFNPLYSSAGEDWEYCLRIARFHRWGYVHRPLFSYRNHTQNTSWNYTRMYFGGMNLLRAHTAYAGPNPFTPAEAREAKESIARTAAERVRKVVFRGGRPAGERLRALGFMLARPRVAKNVLLPAILGKTRRLLGGGRA